MKVLTVKQPWAALIMSGDKCYEFRSWKTNYRGKILIHAGLNLEKDNADRFKDYDLDYKLGYILGEVELVDCILVDDVLNDELARINPVVYGKSNHVRKYAWKLQNVKIYENPVKVKGKLGLWNYDL